jgi:hypothetical protein
MTSDSHACNELAQNPKHEHPQQRGGSTTTKASQITDQPSKGSADEKRMRASRKTSGHPDRTPSSTCRLSPGAHVQHAAESGRPENNNTPPPAARSHERKGGGTPPSSAVSRRLRVEFETVPLSLTHSLTHTHAPRKPRLGRLRETRADPLQQPRGPRDPHELTVTRRSAGSTDSRHGPFLPPQAESKAVRVEGRNLLRVVRRDPKSCGWFAILPTRTRAQSASRVGESGS